LLGDIILSGHAPKSFTNQMNGKMPLWQWQSATIYLWLFATAGMWLIAMANLWLIATPLPPCVPGGLLVYSVSLHSWLFPDIF